MWISREKWDEFNERLGKLEQANQAYSTKEDVHLAVVEASPVFITTTKWQQVHIKEAVQRILDHLGLLLKYQRGTPQSITLAPKDVVRVRMPAPYKRKARA